MNKILNITAASVLLSSSALADIATKTVSFDNQGSTLSGTIYYPENSSNKKLPVVVITGAWTSVQEQMPKAYALEMAKKGFAAMTFDFRGWGKSGDLPNNIRYKEDPKAKISDIRAAFDFIAQQPEIDKSRINGLGICASAGYMIDAVSGNPLVSRVGLVAPWLQNKEIVEQVYGGEQGVSALIAVSQAAEKKGGEIIPAAGKVGQEGVLMPIGGYYYEKNRGGIPEYDNKWDQRSWEGWLTYYPADHAKNLDKPLAIVHSEAAAIPQGVKKFVSELSSRTTIQWIKDVTQFDFYDNPKDVQLAATAITAHFIKPE